MCKFHESVAVSAATDPVTGKVHAGHKAVICVALSRYWASRYVDGAENVDGYNVYPLATAEQQQAFARSGLRRPLQDVREDEAQGLEFLRHKVARLSQRLDLSPRALALPVPTARPAFMDYAIEHIYGGDPKGTFDVVPSVDKEDLKPLHRAVAALHADEQTSSVLERLVQGKICTLYMEAPDRVNKTLINTYEALPERVKAVSASLAKYGGNVVLGGFSGMIGHGVHYASVVGVGVAAGTAASLNLALSGAFLLASYGGWHQAFGGQYRAAREKIGAFAVQAALTAAVAFGTQNLFAHDHMHGAERAWYESLSPEVKASLLAGYRDTYKSLPENLKKRLDLEAEKEGIPPEVFLISCSGATEIARDITAYLTDRKTGAILTLDGPQ